MKKLMSILLILILVLITVCFGVSPSIRSFNVGQVTPKYEARVDDPRYSSACRKVENMLIKAAGSATKRPGTKYIEDGNDTEVRLIPFEYSTDDTYALEFSNGCLRFYRTE